MPNVLEEENEDQSGAVRNAAEDLEFDDSIISKKATYTGNTGEYFIDLTVEGKSRQELETTDIVIVYDNSSSMNTNDRDQISAAETADFVRGLLNEEVNAANNIRMALVTYGTMVFDGRNNEVYSGTSAPPENYSFKTFTSNPNDIINQIPTNVPSERGNNLNGGTFTQQALEEAASLLENSEADNRVIVTLTDGVPTISYDPNRQIVGNGTTFNYNANGQSRTHGQDTISAADSIKSQGITMASIGLELTAGQGATAEQITEVMQGIASTQYDYYPVGQISELVDSLAELSKYFTNTVHRATVTDPMGEYVNLKLGETAGFELATSADLSDGDYFLSASDNTLLQSVILNEEGETITLDNLSLGENEVISLRYKVQLDTDKAGFNPATFYATNAPTLLNPRIEEPDLVHEFPIPEVRGAQAVITGEKTWSDYDQENLRPQEIVVELFRGNDQKIDEQTVSQSEDGSWVFTFEGYSVYDSNGAPIDYTVREQTVDGYASTVNDETNVITNTLVEEPEISLVKTSEEEAFTQAGDIVTYLFDVTNTGNVPLSNIQVIDPKIGEEVELDTTTLNPGEVASGSVQYTVTAEDVEAGTIVNTASVSGEDPAGEPVENDGQDTIPYEPIPSTVVVEHVDEEGNTLIPSIVLEGNVGNPYESVAEEIEGYVLIETPTNATGKFIEEEQTVTYVYAKVAEDVTVVYVDQDGNELATSTIQTGTVGEEYATEPVEIEGYVVIEIPENASGEFGEEAQTVTYVYAKVAGDITVEHVDQEGNALAESSIQSGVVGEEYQTVGKAIEGYTLVEIPANAAGEFKEDPQTVTYVYGQTAADVTVEYVDGNGDPLLDSTFESGIVGDSYTTSPPEIEGYVVIETPENATGEFGEEAQTVTYVYAKVAEDLTVEYVDEDGNELAASTTQTGTVGEEYATEPVEIEGYVVIETPENATGEFGEEAQTVTYVYAKVAEDLTVEYVDEDGNELAASTTQTGTVGEEYATEPVEIEGYVVIETPENATGEFGEEAQTVTYVYAKVAEDLTVEYVDEDGNELAASTTQTGTVGEEYATEPVEIEGYVVIETPANATGEFGEEAQTVTYVYAKVAEDLTVEYVDEDGNELAESTTQTGTVGEEYATEPVEIEGYVVIETPANATGEFGEEAQTVTYVYAKVAEDLTVEYVDEDGNELAASTTQTGTVGEEYATEPVEIEGYVVIETPANATGEFGEEAQTVTYVYAKVAEDLTVEYVDEDGNELAASTTQTGTVGEEYATEPVEIEGYVVIETPENATGEFGEEAQTVTYVYAKVAEDLTVEYVDEDGNELAESTTQTGTVGEEYATEPVEIEGYVVIETPENATGEFGEEAQTVTYVYAKVAEDLTVEYVDEDGNELAASTTQTGTVGEEYATEPVEIEGYVVIETPANATGEFGEEAQTVTYVYAKVAEDLTVEYVDEDGNELAASTTQTGTVGEEYATEPVEIEGYVVIETPENATGEFGEEAQTVTYVYAKVAEDLTVEYVDEDGNELAESTTQTGTVGEEYATEPVEIEGYVVIETPENATGEFGEEAQTVTYVYAKVAEDLTVEYVDEDGNELAASTTQTGTVGEEYATEPVEIEGYVVIETPENATGEFGEEAQTVTYVYAKVAEDLTVEYVDEDGNELAASTTQTGTVGEEYATEPVEIEGYVVIETPANATGEFGEEAQTVTYVYAKVAEDLTVEYVDEDGNELAASTTQTGTVGEEYATEPVEIEGYVVIETPANATGEFGEEAQTVTYVYAKVAEDLTVEYVDEDGNELAASTTQTGTVGEEYATEPVEIEGYVVIETPENATGEFGEEAQTVTYVYAKVAEDLTVEYVDEDGNELAESTTQTGTVGEEYATEPVEIEGYVVIETPENATGEFGEEAQTVTYVYAKIAGDITVEYVDQEGNELAESTTQTGTVGAEYATEPVEIDGFELVEVPSNATGEFTEDPQTVTYVYQPVQTPVEPGTVTVNHVDEEGNALTEPELLSGEIGTDYTTEAKEFEGYVLTTTPDNASGQFTDEDQTVTYVYAKIASSNSSITVKYVDQEGNELAAPTTQVGAVGEAYSTEPIEVDGFELVEVPSNATGEFTEAPQTVTYVYQPVQTPIETGTVVVNHVDEKGNALTEPELLSGEVGIDYTTEMKEFEGYVLITTPDNASGQFTNETQTVTYVYGPAEVPEVEGVIVVEYVDTEGTPLADPMTDSGLIGSGYTTAPLEIEGYDLVEVPSNAEGVFGDEPQTVTYVYVKKLTRWVQLLSYM
nr:MucBP domain-containing protein [Planococcus sp. MSAK28401]